MPKMALLIHHAVVFRPVGTKTRTVQNQLNLSYTWSNRQLNDSLSDLLNQEFQTHRFQHEHKLQVYAVLRQHPARHSSLISDPNKIWRQDVCHQCINISLFVLNLICKNHKKFEWVKAL